MNKYVICTDACCDLGKDFREKFGIEYIQMPLSCDGESLPKVDLDWKQYSPNEFYDKIRNGFIFKTSQINVSEYVEAFELFLKEGYDILSITCSSGLSGSVNCSRLAKDELLQKYPNAKIFCIDTLRGSLGEGLLVYYAAKMREDGKTIEEVAKWLDDNKLYVNQIGTVSTLTYLKRAGRVTTTAAFFGNFLQVKPLIVSDAKGQNFVLCKVKGRKNSIDQVIAYTKANVINPEEQTLFIVHADCYDVALQVRDEILKDCKFKDVYINYVGPIIGSTVGPGMIGVYYFGNIQDLNK